MNKSRSAEEVKEGYVSAMGEELGAAFFSLYVRLVELHALWLQYRQLFGTDLETVQLLNRTAGLFFKIVQDELWDSVLLGISRLTDPPNTRQGRNLTLQTLPMLVTEPALKAEVEALCATAVSTVAFAREHRNKRIAHQDHGYFIDRSSHELNGISRERVEEMLAALREVMNRLDLHFRDSTVLYEEFVDNSGARVLVSKLRQLERMKGVKVAP